MKLIKVGAAVLNQTPRDWKGNVSRINEAIKEASQNGVTVLCLPEMTITGYGMEDDYFCADVPNRAMKKLIKIIGDNSIYLDNMIVCVGLPIRFNNTLYNGVATIVGGGLFGITCKQHLAGDGIHYENRWFKEWPQGVVQTTKIDGWGDKEIPIGDIHFNIGGVKIGYEICEDAWVANRPGSILSTKGVDIYLNPSASHFSFGKLDTRRNFVVEGSRAFNGTYIYTNLNGNEAGRAIYDGGALIATGGKLVAAGQRFSYKDVLLTTAVVDIDTTRTQNVRTASFQSDPQIYNEGCVSVNNFTYPTVNENVTTLNKNESWENHPISLKHEECTRALGLALMDYMRKSHTKGFVVSLSGGADSAMVTYACVTGIRLGIKELGIAEFVEKYCPHLKTDKYTPDVGRNIVILTEKLITTAYQPTENSGHVTRNAAEILAKSLGVSFMVLNVDTVFKEYLKIGKQINGDVDLNFDNNDLTLQNLQARVRSPSIWMIANMENKLLLTTSNMSEAAVGYATMDGDTSGCVAPIAGLPKVYVREYLRWAENIGPLNIGCLSALSFINKQTPTAELRPSDKHQTDETDLMPYDLLHQIETMVVKNRYTPEEIYLSLIRESRFTPNELVGYIRKFFRLFSINQWKRERYALSFHMDDHNLDPRTWCRTPILTGGYEEELEELDKYLL